MGNVLTYVEIVGGRPSLRSERLLALGQRLAAELGGSLVAMVADSEPGAMVSEIDAADVIIEVAHPALSPYIPEAHVAVLAAAIAAQAPDVVLIENTTAGLDVAAGAAMATGLPLVSYCTGVRLEDRAAVSTSEVYGGQLIATARTPLPAVFALSGDALPREPVARGRGERVAMAPPALLDELRTRFVEDMTLSGGDIDIARAARLVAVGRGIGGANNLKVAEDLAAVLGAELAASRPVVDAGWLPRGRQVGKSGVAVKPRLYLALGISGAPEHLEGMRESELIIAINKDAHAGIFNVAHFGAVADLFDVAEELTKLASVPAAASP